MPQEELWDISQLLRGLALSVGRPGSQEVLARQGEQQQATWAESCQEPASGLPFSQSTDGRTIATRAPPESPQNTPKGYAAQGLCSRVHTAKNSQTWAWKGRDGAWGAAVLGPSPSGYLGVWR